MYVIFAEAVFIYTSEFSNNELLDIIYDYRI